MVVYRKHLANPLDYLDYHYADEYSIFSQKRKMKYAYFPNSSSPMVVTTSVSYYIDGNEVDEQTFFEVMNKVQDSYEIITNKKCDFQIVEDGIGETTWKLNIGDDNMTWLDYIKPVNKNGVKWDYRSDTIYLDYLYRFDESYLDDYRYFLDTINNLHLNNNPTTGLTIVKGDSNMNKNITIANYKYDEKTGRTTLWWSDNTQTTVTADPDTEASQYVGFVSACAKKLFGNKSTYLNQFDKWTVKIPARQKAEAEKKATEDKIHAEAKAKRDAKKAKRKKQREIEKLAKQIADEYYAQELTEEAEKLAIKKYGVPKSYLDEYDCDCCECNCKEFDVMDDDNITD